MTENPIRAALLILLAGALFACGGRQHRAPDDALTDAGDLYDAMNTRLDALSGTRIRAVMEYYESGRRVRVRQAVLAQQPADLRIETISPFDSTLAVVVVNHDSLALYDLQNSVFYSGAPTAQNLSRFIPVWMSPGDIVSVLLGGAPADSIVSDRSRWELEWDRRANAYRLTLPTLHGGHMDLYVQHGSWSLTGAKEYDPDGDLVFELRAGSFERVSTEGGDVTVPHRLRFLMAGENLDVSLDVDRYDANPELPATIFALQPPSGIQHIVLPDL